MTTGAGTAWDLVRDDSFTFGKSASGSSQRGLVVSDLFIGFDDATIGVRSPRNIGQTWVCANRILVQAASTRPSPSGSPRPRAP